MENQGIANIKLLITVGILITLFLVAVIILFVVYYQRKMLLKEVRIKLIGVGKEGKHEYNNANNDFFNTASKSVARIPGYGTMAALALQGINYFNKVQGEDNVKYWFISDWDNVLLFKNGSTFYQYKQGDVTNDASQMKTPKLGKVYLGLMNDNLAEPIDVIVKATAIVVIQQWGIRTIQKTHINSQEIAYLKN